MNIMNDMCVYYSNELLPIYYSNELFVTYVTIWLQNNRNIHL